MQKIVIFDMDGTLIDSKKDITISINYVRAEHYGLGALSEEYVVEAINMKVRNLPKLFYTTDEYHEKDRELFETHYAKQCTQNPYLYDGIEDTLRELNQSDVKLAVATNAPTKFANLMLTSLGVVNLFGIIIGADYVRHSKPSPEMIYKILHFYNYQEKEDKAWMIGDNSKDMMSAKNANIEALFATWGFSTTSENERIVEHPTNILKIVI